MLTVLLSIVCFVAGCILTWLFRKKLVEKNYVSAYKFNEQNQQLIAVQTEKNMTEKNLLEVHSHYKVQAPVKLTTLRQFKLTSGGRCKLTTSGRSKLTTG
jgi:uncharacterized protein YneF (UPF0154 family)